MNKEDGGSAFPHKKSNNNGYTVAHPGMTLRDYFAGQALAAIGDRRWNGDENETATQKGARACYALADAMLAARSGEQQ